MTCPDCNGLKVVPRIVYHRGTLHHNTTRSLLDVPGYGDVRLVGEIRDRTCPGCGGRGEVKKERDRA